MTILFHALVGICGLLLGLIISLRINNVKEEKMHLFLKQLSWILLLPARIVVYSVLLLALALAWIVGLETGIEDGLDLTDLVPLFPEYQGSLGEAEDVEYDDEFDSLRAAFVDGVITLDELRGQLARIGTEEFIAKEARIALDDAEFDLEDYIRSRITTRLREGSEATIESAILGTGAFEELIEAFSRLDQAYAPSVLVIDTIDNMHADLIKFYQDAFGELNVDAPEAPATIYISTETMNICGLDVAVGITLKDGTYEVRGLNYPRSLFGTGRSVPTAKYDFKMMFQAAYGTRL